MSESLELPGQSQENEANVGSISSTQLRTALSSVEAGVVFMRLAGKQVKGGENIPTPAAVATAATAATAVSTAPPHPVPMEDKKAKSKSNRKEKKANNKTPNQDVKDGHRTCEDMPQIHVSGGDDNGDWYEDMDENTLSTFRDLFNMLDQSNTGIITADNLYEELRRVDSEITFSEVEDVLKKVDKDGNGEIDFDEFLYHMTHMGGEGVMEGADDEAKKKHIRRRQMFYQAITQFSIKQTLADIEKTFRKQAPHVISHYSDGVRLIGLTTRQLERQMKRMQKNVGKTDSPYAKPLPFVHMGGKTVIHKKKIIPQDIPTSCRDLPQETEHREPSQTAVADLSQEISDTMKMFEESGPNAGKLPDASFIMKLRQKIGNVKAQLRSKDMEGSDPESSPNSPMLPPRTPPPPVTINVVGSKGNIEPLNTSPTPPVLLQSPNSRQLISKKKSLQDKAKSTNDVCIKKKTFCLGRKDKVIGMGWTTPRIQYMDVPLPSLKIKLKSKNRTFNNLYKIRGKAEEATEIYYHKLREAAIRNAWDHWDRLYADVVLPKKLLENFRKVYGFYSPHREEEVFVVCPWKPGPFQNIGHVDKGPTVRLPNFPDFHAGRSSPRVKSTMEHLIVKPRSALFGSEPTSRSSSRQN